MTMVKQIGKYLNAYVANGVAPAYKQKSYGKYKLSKLLIKYICNVHNYITYANMGILYTNMFSNSIIRSGVAFSSIGNHL